MPRHRIRRCNWTQLNKEWNLAREEDGRMQGNGEEPRWKPRGLWKGRGKLPAVMGLLEGGGIDGRKALGAVTALLGSGVMVMTLEGADHELHLPHQHRRAFTIYPSSPFVYIFQH